MFFVELANRDMREEQAQWEVSMMLLCTALGVTTDSTAKLVQSYSKVIWDYKTHQSYGAMNTLERLVRRLQEVRKDLSVQERLRKFS